MRLSIYNLDYYERLLRLYSKTAEKICKIRWDFVKEINPKTVLDYGSGVGWFRAFQPSDIKVDSYDIANFPQTGIKRKLYDLVCFWDVLEHLPNFKEIESVLNAKYLALTIPIKPKNVKLKEWKHYKPGEHLHYFSIEMLDTLFGTYSFKRIKDGHPECPPRQDAYSALYEKANSKK